MIEKMRKCFIIIFLALIGAVFQPTPALAKSLQSTMDRGMRAYYQKNWIKAAHLFRKVLYKNPDNSLAMVAYVVSKAWVGDLRHKVEQLEDRLVDYPDDQNADVRLAFFEYAYAEIRGKSFSRALNEFRLAARMGQSSIVHTGIGIIYFNQGHLDLAQRQLAFAMQINPKDVLAYEYMGRILLQFNHQPKLALNYFKQEVKLSPFYPDAHYYLARTYQKIGEALDAEIQYQKTIHLDPLGVGEGFNARISLGDLYVQTAQFNKAKEIYQKALELYPDSPIIRKRLTQLQKQEKNKVK
jgi:tetratricopeptide (TPR) repeat protein